VKNKKPISQIDHNLLRKKAISVINRVLKEWEPLDEVLADVFQKDFELNKNRQQKAWVQDVCSGVLRWQGRLGYYIDSNASKNPPSGWLRNLLYIGVYQLIAQKNVSPASVVFETVELAKIKQGIGASRFVNKILRKISDQKTTPSVELQKEFPNNTQIHAAYASLPKWYWNRIKADHGEVWAKDYARASLERPVLWARFRDLHWAGNKFLGLEITSGPVPASWCLVSGGRPQNYPGFSEGELLIQDISSQALVHEVVWNVKNIFKKQANKIRVLDICGAPGGKSIGMSWSGINVFSSDLPGPRINLLKSNIKKLDYNVNVLETTQAWNMAGSADLIWVDAPCSSSGLIRRHPDIRWIKKESDLSEIGKIQSTLIKKAWKHLRPGGLMVYSVCSVFKEEGIQRLIEHGLNDKIIKEYFYEPQKHPHGDGFWGAILQKVD